MQLFHPLPQVLHSFPAKLWAETARTLTLKRTKEVKESNLPVSMRRRSEVLWFENFWARSHYVEPLYTILCCLRELRHHFKFILLQNRAVRVTPQASMIALFSLCLYNYQFLPTPSCLFLRFLEPLHFLKHRWWWWLFFFPLSEIPKLLESYLCKYSTLASMCQALFRIISNAMLCGLIFFSLILTDVDMKRCRA